MLRQIFRHNLYTRRLLRGVPAICSLRLWRRDILQPKYNISGQRLAIMCVSAHYFLNSMELFPLPVGLSFNIDIEAYNRENTYLLGTCSSKASSLELGGQYSISSCFSSPIVGYQGIHFLWNKMLSGYWLCTNSYRFKVRIPKYIQYSPMLMPYKTSYDSSFKEREYLWPWYSMYFEQYTGGKKQV